MVPGLLQIFLHGCEIKSGSGLGTRLGNNATVTFSNEYPKLLQTWTLTKNELAYLQYIDST